MDFWVWDGREPPAEKKVVMELLYFVFLKRIFFSTEVIGVLISRIIFLI